MEASHVPGDALTVAAALASEGQVIAAIERLYRDNIGVELALRINVSDDVAWRAVVHHPAGELQAFSDTAGAALARALTTHRMAA